MITQSLKSFSTGRHLAAGSSRFRGFCAATSVHGETALAAVEEEAPSAGTFADKHNTSRTMWGLYRRISAIGASKDKVANVLDGYVREGRVIRKNDLLSCVTKFRNLKRHQHCLEILVWMDKSKYVYTHKDRALHLDIISTTKGISEAEQLFESLSSEDKNLHTYGALLQCYCREKLTDKAAQLVKEMEKLNYVSSLTFINLMSLSLSTGEPEKVPRLVEEMKTRNFPMSSYTYTILVQSYKQLNDMEAVERTVQEIVKEDSNCHWTFYSNLASMYIKDGNFEKTEMALKKLEESTKNLLNRNPFPYHSLISFYAHIGNLAAVCRIWEYLKADSGITDNLSYKIMLQAQLKLGQLDNLVKYFKEWESEYKIYDLRIPSILISGYLKQNKIEEAEKVFNDAVKKSGKQFFSGRDMLVAYLLDKRKINRVLEHLEAAADANKVTEIWRPSHERIFALCQYFEEEKDVDGAEKLLKLLRRLKCLSSNSYLWLLRIYVAAEKIASDMRHRMKEDGFEITSEHNVLLEKVCPPP